jgi:sulfite exporter TauE/SafE
MTDHLAMFAAWCGPDGPGLLLGLFFAGLASGPLHCAPMCGPFVLGQTSERLARIPAAGLCEFARLRAGLLLPYHLGRLLTYAGIGALAARLGALPGLGRLSSASLLVGALLFLLLALLRLVPAVGRRLPTTRAPVSLVRLIAAASRRVDRTRWHGGLLLGIALGFLPCGLLYAALAVAAGGGGASRGALAMAAFGLGTVPTLAAVGIAGQVAGRMLQGRLAVAAPALLLANAALLATAAWQALLRA